MLFINLVVIQSFSKIITDVFSLRERKKKEKHEKQ
jgi:hypothetical protein